MSRLFIHFGSVVLVVFLVFIFAACSSPVSSTPVLEQSVGTSAPTFTLPSTLESTPTPQPPDPSPTQVPPPKPLSFDTFTQFQLISMVENTDQSWDLFTSTISGDGRLAAVAGCLLEGDDKACHGTTFFRILDLQTGVGVSDPEYLSPAIEVLAFSPDGSVLAAAGCDISLWLHGEDGTICDLPRVWLIDTITGQIIAELGGYTSHVTDFAFSTDSSVLFTAVVFDRYYGDGDHVLRVYDTRSGEKITTVETGMINCTYMLLDISPDGRYLIGNVRSPCVIQSFVAWWDITDPRAPVQVGKVDGFGKSQVSPDSTQILVNNMKDFSLMVYDLKTGSSLKIIPAVPGLFEIRRFTYLHNNATIMLDMFAEYVIIDVPSGEIIQRLTVSDDESLSGYILSHDRSTLFLHILGETNRLVAWDLATWQSLSMDLDLIHTFLFDKFFDPYYANAVFLPDGTGFVGVNATYGFLQVQSWGVPDFVQADAEQSLRGYFDLLVSGDYDQAAALYIDQAGVRAATSPYIYFYPQYPVLYATSLLPDLDFSNLSGVLDSLCGNQDFPCLPMRDIIRKSRLYEGLYQFTVTFALSDGSLADWSSCEAVPLENYCKHRGGSFVYYVYQQPGGDFKIVEGLPPAIALLLGE